MTGDNTNRVSRRAVLRTTGGTAAGFALVGAARAEEGHDESSEEDDHEDGCWYPTVKSHGGHGEQDSGEHGDPVQQVMCPDHPHANTGSGHTMQHVNGGMSACPVGTGLDQVCGDEKWPDGTDWPEETIRLIKKSRRALTTAYDDVGTLIAQGYIPYFDVVRPGATGGVSHWLNPGYINDTSAAPDPWRPESIIMDNQWWKPLGPMYIATDEGDPIWANKEKEVMAVRSLWGYENDCGVCSPFHPHDGVPGRFAWWYYRQVHEADYASGDPEDLMLPCYTAPMMHAWIYPTPHGPHSATSGAPPREHRPGGPPNRPGYPTPAVPGEDELSLEVLPDAVREAAMPARLERELEVIDDLSVETLETTPIGKLEGLIADRLGPADGGLDALGSLSPDHTL